MSNKLQIGDKAPNFEGLNQNGKKVSLSDFKGKKLVLFFYPKDDTPGCTKQNCNLRDNYKFFKNDGFELLGVSADSQDKHKKFISKYDLPFDLLSDEEKKVIKSYGAWGKKKFMGKEYEGIIRMTFVIDEKSNIVDIVEKVKTKEHSSQILKK